MRSVLLYITVAAVSLGAAAVSAAPRLTTLDSFPADAGGSYAPLAADGTGALYGTTVSGGSGAMGSVFKLVPPTPGSSQWTEETLWSFTNGADGGFPYAGLTLRSNTGTLYGVTPHGGANGWGTVFALTPPAAGQTAWTLTTLWNFPVGYYPGSSGVALNRATGALFGTTESGGNFGHGTVFELSPPAGGGGAWTASWIWSFGANAGDGVGPANGVSIDSTGALYGTTLYGGIGGCPDGFGGTTSCGTVFKLTPPPRRSTVWTESVLYAFSSPADGFGPNGGVLVDATGAVYGTTNHGGTGAACNYLYNNQPINMGCGTVFKIAAPQPNQTQGQHTIVWNFAGGPGDGEAPFGNLIADTAGSLYGTTFSGGPYGGIDYKLFAPTPGSAQWTMTILGTGSAAPNGYFPSAGFVERRGVLYGTMVAGGANNAGTVYDITGGGWGNYAPGALSGPPVPATAPVCIATTVTQPTANQVASVSYTNSCSHDVYFYACEVQAVSPRGNYCGAPPAYYDLLYFLAAQTSWIDEIGVGYTGGIEYAGVRECPQNTLFPAGLITSLICVRP